MSKRRGFGEGSIYQTAEGRWRATVSLGYDHRGKRVRRSVSGKTKRDVREKLSELERQAQMGTLTGTSQQTVQQYLEQWLQDSARPQIEGTTFKRYEGILKTHVYPAIGSIRLAKLTAAHVQGLLATMERKGLSGHSRHKAFVVLQKALTQAVRWRLIGSNVCTLVDAPKVPKRDIRPLTEEQVKGLRKTAKGDRLEALFVLAISTGMRQGELFGLQWEDVDLQRGHINVRHSLEELNGVHRLKEPKSASGRRCVTLPRMAIDALWKHKRQTLAEGLASVSWVFCDSDGGPLRKSNVERRHWKPIRKKAELPDDVRFHDLRHTHATLLLAADVNPKIVQERLGHASIKQTLDLYSHVIPSMQRNAADSFDAVFSRKRKNGTGMATIPG